MKTLVNIVTALALAGGIESAVAQWIVPAVPANPAAFNGATAVGMTSINNGTNSGITGGYDMDSMMNCTFNPAACGIISETPESDVIIKPNFQRGYNHTKRQIIENLETNVVISWIKRYCPTCELTVERIELTKQWMRRAYGQNHSVDSLPDAAPDSSPNTETKLNINSTNNTSVSTTTTLPPQSTFKDPCPENLSLDQLRSYTIVTNSPPPIERYYNKSGCRGIIVYNSAEGRIMYHTSSSELTATSRVTNIAGKTIFDGNSAGAVEATGAPTTPPVGYFDYMPNFVGCANNMTISTQMAMGLGLGALVVSTPLVYFFVRRRSRMKVTENVYTTRMGV